MGRESDARDERCGEGFGKLEGRRNGEMERGRDGETDGHLNLVL